MKPLSLPLFLFLLISSCNPAKNRITPELEQLKVNIYPGYHHNHVYAKKLTSTDTLKYGCYNIPVREPDLEADFLPPFLDQYEPEITDIRFAEGKKHLEQGLRRYTKYSLSTHKISAIDDGGGIWYNRWTVEIFEYPDVESAVHEFNIHLKEITYFDQFPYYYQGCESRRVLIGRRIFYVLGDCKETWFVKNATDRILNLFLGTSYPEPKTMIRTFCGSGSGYNI